MIHRYEILEIDTKLAKSLIQRIMIQHKMESEMLKNKDDKTFNFCKWHSRYKKSQFCHPPTRHDFTRIFFLRSTQCQIYKHNSFVLCLEVCLTRYYISPLSAYFSYIKKSG